VNLNIELKSVITRLHSHTHAYLFNALGPVQPGGILDAGLTTDHRMNTNLNSIITGVIPGLSACASIL
jgi:hypothetical protein